MHHGLISRARRAAECLAVACALSSVAKAQSTRVIRGTILDASDRPIGSAAILVMSGASAISDDSGRFRVEISHRNRVVLDVRRVGFMPSRIGVGEGGDTTVSVLLLPITQRLPTVEVSNTALRPPSLAGFEERMSERRKGAGLGTFITDRDIEKMNASRVTQAVENVPSIFVRRVSGDRYGVYAKASGGGAECPAAVFLDGIRVKPATEYNVDRRGRTTSTQHDGGVPLDDYVQPAEVAGVEIYPRAILAPPQLQPVADERAMKCAVVAIWTKHR
jgi:hypothetical protein